MRIRALQKSLYKWDRIGGEVDESYGRCSLIFSVSDVVLEPEKVLNTKTNPGELTHVFTAGSIFKG